MVSLGEKGNIGGLFHIIILLLGCTIWVSIISLYGFSGPDRYLDYNYANLTNSTNLAFDTTTNATHSLPIILSSVISGETDGSYLQSTVLNSNETIDANITVYLNSASLGTFVASANTSTSYNFTELYDNLQTGTNTIIYESDLDLQNATESFLYYQESSNDAHADELSNLMSYVITMVIFLTMGFYILYSFKVAKK